MTAKMIVAALFVAISLMPANAQQDSKSSGKSAETFEQCVERQQKQGTQSDTAARRCRLFQLGQGKGKK